MSGCWIGFARSILRAPQGHVCIRLIALACYAPLSWRPKYLASALILGPFTLDRPVIAILDAALGVALSNDAAVATAVGLSVIAVLAASHPPAASGTHATHLGLPADLPSALRRREVRKTAVYDHAMGLFRSAVGLFRGRASKDREEAAAGLRKEQAKTVTAQAEVARPEVKLEARPNPDNPGWGRTVGQEIGKAREDRAIQE